MESSQTDLNITNIPSSSRTLSSPVFARDNEKGALVHVNKSATWHPLHKDSIVLDTPFIVTDTEEEFFDVNRPMIKKKILEEAQDHVLKLKWKTIMREKSLNDYGPIVKRPRISISQNIFEEPPKNYQNNNELPRKKILIRNIDAIDPKNSDTNDFKKMRKEINDIKIKTVHELNKDQTKDEKTSKKMKPPIENVIDLTKSCSDGSNCNCDDCKFVTESHKKRILTGKFKCKCHPCQLRQIVLKERKTDPFKVVKLAKYKGGSISFWRESWIDDMFSDIFMGKMSLEEATKMVGSSLIVTEFMKYKTKHSCDNK